jgi:hypothetical protein
MSSSTPTDCDEPIFLVFLPFVLARKVGALKDLYCTAEVQATLMQRFLPFSLVKLNFHLFIVHPINDQPSPKRGMLISTFMSWRVDVLNFICLLRAGSLSVLCTGLLRQVILSFVEITKT